MPLRAARYPKWVSQSSKVTIHLLNRRADNRAIGTAALAA